MAVKTCKLIESDSYVRFEYDKLSVKEFIDLIKEEKLFRLVDNYDYGSIFTNDEDINTLIKEEYETYPVDSYDKIEDLKTYEITIDIGVVGFYIIFVINMTYKKKDYDKYYNCKISKFFTQSLDDACRGGCFFGDTSSINESFMIDVLDPEAYNKDKSLEYNRVEIKDLKYYLYG